VLFSSDDGAIPSQNAAVSLVARVLATSSIDGFRFFTTQLTAFKQRDDDGPVYETFHVICIMAPDTRWGKVRFPAVNSYAQVMGDVIGFATSGDIKCLCLLLSQLSYIQGPRSLAGCSGSTSVVPATPPSRKRRVATLASYPSATRTATTSVPSSDGPASSVSAVATGVDSVRAPSPDIDESPLKKKSTTRRGK